MAGTSRKRLLEDVRRVVIKVGTTSIMNDGKGIDDQFMDRAVDQVHSLREEGMEVILVSSGAIGIGIEVMGATPKPYEIPVRQAAASVGQSILMNEWQKRFDRVDMNVAQILLTYDFYSDRVRYLNLRNTISTLMEIGIVPIINENDSTCTNEIEAVFGDNDTLSAMVASKIEADLLIMLSDVDGLYDKNPKTNRDARLVSFVEDISPEIEAFGGNPISTRGVGGMRTKIEAAKICQMSGCHMTIVNHQEENIILRAVRGDEVGTFFRANESISKNRIRWILLAKPSGTIRVDRGAKEALQDSNGLLPSGVTGVDGEFKRGDIVEVACDGTVFAKGITDFNSDELRKVMGAQSDEIEEILGYMNYDNVIRQNNLGCL